MRFYFRTSRSTGVSVGLVGGLVLGVLLAAAWFSLAVLVVASFAAALLYTAGRALLRRLTR